MELARGLEMPISIFAPRDGSQRVFVLEQRGRVRLVRGGTLLEAPVLDITDRVSCCGERGLLDLTFDPDFDVNQHVYVNYTDRSGDTVIARFTAADASAEQIDRSTERVLMKVQQPFGNHNGGQLRFGPDGKLYIALGDGGAAGDPGNRAQRLDTLLGKILRIDIDGDPYAIPSDNPFVGVDGARGEIWAYGLRNPWRFSFDRTTGDLWIADVGQGRVEEVDFAPSTSRGGENYGWRKMEGSSCFEPASGCRSPDLVLPVVEYEHDEGCSVTGGYVYRGRSHRELRGAYIFGDFCSGTIWTARRGEDGRWSREVLMRTALTITSFGETSAGEILVLDYSGTLYRLGSAAPRKRPVSRPGSINAEEW